MTDHRTIDPRIQRMLRAQVRSHAAQETRRGTSSGASGVTSVEKSVLVELSRDRIPEEFAKFRWDRIVNSIYLLTLPLDEFERLAAHPSVVYIEAGRKAGTSLTTSRAAIKADQAQRFASAVRGLDGSGVIIGIVDDGLDYTLDDFRDSDGTTRIAYLWDQRLVAQEGENAPAEFGFSVEYDRAAINRALQNADPFSIVRHKPEAAKHGTHVAGVAVGNGRSHDEQFLAGQFIGVAPNATIIFVQVGYDESQTDSAETVRSFADTVHIATGVSYIFQKARELGMPCVINISLAVDGGGSRDGETVLEHLIDALLRQKGRAAVVAANNEGDLQGHAFARLRAGETRVLNWEIDSFQRAPQEVEIWHRSQDLFKVRLINPAGKATPWIQAGGKFDVEDDGFSNAITIEAERFTAMNGDGHIYIAVSRAVGEGSDPNGVILKGQWKIEVNAIEAQDGRFDAWIERIERRSGKFITEDCSQPKTMGSPATSRHCIAVANFDHTDGTVNPSSGRGPTRDGRYKPEIAAPGTNIMSSCSLGGTKVEGGGAVPMRIAKTGTSMATPHVTGAVALLLQEAPGLTAAQIRELLISGAAHAPGSATGFDIEKGFGFLDVERTIGLLDFVRGHRADTE